MSQSFLSLPQFCLQLSGLYVTQTVPWSISSSVDNSGMLPLNVFFLLSSFGHFLSLTSGQYLGLMIQHENSLSSHQRYISIRFIMKIQEFFVIWRILYLVASMFNSISMMSASALFITLLFLSTFWILLPYHIFMMMFLLATLFIINLLVKTCSLLLGIKSSGIDTVFWKSKHPNLSTKIGGL